MTTCPIVVGSLVEVNPGAVRFGCQDGVSTLSARHLVRVAGRRIGAAMAIREVLDSAAVDRALTGTSQAAAWTSAR